MGIITGSSYETAQKPQAPGKGNNVGDANTNKIAVINSIIDAQSLGTLDIIKSNVTFAETMKQNLAKPEQTLPDTGPTLAQHPLVLKLANLIKAFNIQEVFKFEYNSNNQNEVETAKAKEDEHRTIVSDLVQQVKKLSDETTSVNDQPKVNKKPLEDAEISPNGNNAIAEK